MYNLLIVLGYLCRDFVCIIPILFPYFLALSSLYLLSISKIIFITYYIFICVERMTVCPKEESILMTSFVDSLSHLQDKESKLTIY